MQYSGYGFLLLNGFQPIFDFVHIPKYIPQNAHLCIVEGSNIHAVFRIGGRLDSIDRQYFPPLACGDAIAAGQFQSVMGIFIFYLFDFCRKFIVKLFDRYLCLRSWNY